MLINNNDNETKKLTTAKNACEHELVCVCLCVSGYQNAHYIIGRYWERVTLEKVALRLPLFLSAITQPLAML